MPDSALSFAWDELLRAEVKPESDTLRARLITAVIERASSLDTRGVQEVARFLDAYQQNRGCTTPGEQLIVRLVHNHYREGLTPEDLADEINEFRENFAMAAEAYRRMREVYHPSTPLEASDAA